MCSRRVTVVLGEGGAGRCDCCRRFVRISTVNITTTGLVADVLGSCGLRALRTQLGRLRRVRRTTSRGGRRVVDCLCDSFLPPLRHRSVVGLTNRLSAAVSAVRSALVRVSVCRVGRVAPRVLGFVSVVRGDTLDLSRTVGSLGGFGGSGIVGSTVVTVGHLRGQKSSLCAHSIGGLFIRRGSTLTAVTAAGVCSQFRQTASSFRTTTGIVRAVILGGSWCFFSCTVHVTGGGRTTARSTRVQ